MGKVLSDLHLTLPELSFHQPKQMQFLTKQKGLLCHFFCLQHSFINTIQAHITLSRFKRVPHIPILLGKLLRVLNRSGKC